MELNSKDIEKIISSNPGDFAIYKIIDGKFLTIYHSPSLARISGLTEEEYEEMTAADASAIVMDADRELVASNIPSILAGSDVTLQYRIYHRETSFAWVMAKGRMIGTSDGAPLIISIFTNISSTTESHASLLDRSADIAYVIDKNTHELLYANHQAIMGVKGNGSYCGRKCYEYVSNLDKPCPWCSIANMKDGFYHGDASYAPEFDMWFRVDCREVDWFGHQAIAIFSSNITEQIKQQESLTYDRDMLQDIITRLPVGVGVSEFKDGKVTPIAVNPYVQKILNTGAGFSLSDPKMIAQIHEHDREYVMKEMISLPFNERDVSFAFRYRDSIDSDEYRWVRINSRAAILSGRRMVFACLSDITAEKASELEAKNARSMYEAAVSVGKLVVWEYDIVHHCITMGTNEFTSYDHNKFGLPPHMDNVPESLLPFIADEDAEKFLDLYKKIDAGSPTASCEVWYKLNEGHEPRCEYITYTTVFDESGRPVRAYGIGQNITSQKMEAEKYRRLYRQLTENNPNSIGSFRLNLTTNYCGDGQSPYPEILLRQKAGTVDGYISSVACSIADEKMKKEFISNFSREQLIDGYRHGISQYDFTYPIVLSDEKLHWAEVYVHLLQNPDTGDVEALCYTVDNTEKKKDDEIIAKVTDEKCDYIGLIDPAARTFEFHNTNKNIDKLPIKTRMNYEKCITYDIVHFVASEDHSLFRQNTAISRIIAEISERPGYSFTYRHNNGDQMLLKQLQYSWLNDSKTEILVIQTDLTESYEQEQNQLHIMEETLKIAESANRAKSDFLSRISHDIRTPMNVISNMTSFAMADMNDKKKLSYDLSTIKASNAFLLSLINDMLDISKIDSGHIELRAEPYPYSEFISNITNMFEPLCVEKSINFHVEQTGTSAVITTDKVRLNQIVMNIISNAVRYTNAGGTITFTSFGQRTDNGMIDCSFSIKDNGIGMSEKFQKTMFEPFAQETDNPLRDHEMNGTGLGLSIVKKLTDLMGGTINVTSTVGQGTEISVSFRFPEAMDTVSNNAQVFEDHESASRPRGSAPKILIAEDHRLNSIIAVRLLTTFGYETFTASNGAEAVDAFSNSEIGGFAAILMDIQMPEMNGYEATKKIRSLKRPDAQTIPIIAMTANAFSDDVSRCLAAGMNAHISKPLDPEILKKTLKKFTDI